MGHLERNNHPDHARSRQRCAEQSPSDDTEALRCPGGRRSYDRPRRFARTTETVLKLKRDTVEEAINETF